MKRAYADIPEGQMHYRAEGEGEPVLLLHMAVGSSDEFTRVIPFLSKPESTVLSSQPRATSPERLQPTSWQPDNHLIRPGAVR